VTLVAYRVPVSSCPDDRSAVFRAYRGGTYTRGYLIMFWLMAVAALGLGLWSGAAYVALAILGVVGAMGVVVLASTAQSVLSPQGVRLVLRRRWIPWSDVAEVLDPRPGDTELRVRTHDGSALTVKGAPATVAVDLRAALHHLA